MMEREPKLTFENILSLYLPSGALGTDTYVLTNTVTLLLASPFYSHLIRFRYTWGDKENGVAGHGDTEGHQYTPKLLERMAGKRVIQLSACGFHTGCLTDSGEVYSWGEGKFGRLGHGTERNCHSPRLVETLLGKRPIQVACGGFHTAVITEDGKMYTFGGGEHGQLGHGDKVNKVKPTVVQALEGIFVSQITCGWSHSVALTSKGRVYVSTEWH
mmetsp:Transcript_36127/g.73361  ORF Transcript_36127/g.73361 Transcript_36127/m.73361 type:complete len:215 (+) Transcript_36127:1217-1861(+)